jgi:hypothetical protein
MRTFNSRWRARILLQIGTFLFFDHTGLAMPGWSGPGR